MQPRNPNYREGVEAAFRGPFIADVGIELRDCGPGWVETSLVLAPRHFQHSAVVHAGVICTMADHSCGGAAFTLVPADESVVTVEFKANFLRAARGQRLACRGEIIKAGAAFSIGQADVFAFDGSQKVHVARLIATLTTVSARTDGKPKEKIQ